MTQYVVADFVNTQLAAAASSSATTLTLASSANLPTLSTGQQMPLVLNDAATGQNYEIVYVTAITGVTLTVLRAQEGTGALNWNVGDYAYCGPTSGSVATAFGNPGNVFAVAPATVANQAPQLSQLTSTSSPLALATTAAASANQAVNLGQFASSVGANGYTKLPNGVILQAGTAVTNGSGVATFTFPIAFPTAVMGLAGFYIASSTSIPSSPVTVSDTTSTSKNAAVMVAAQAGAAFPSANIRIIAMGY